MTKDWVHGVGHSPICQILLQIVVRAVITSSPPAWTSSAGMLSAPAGFPFFRDCTAASTSLRRMGWSSSVSVWVQFSTDGSPLALWLYSSGALGGVDQIVVGTAVLDYTSCSMVSGAFIIIINPLTARVVGAPQMILQPVFSIFPCSPLPSGTCRTPAR